MNLNQTVYDNVSTNLWTNVYGIVNTNLKKQSISTKVKSSTLNSLTSS